MESQFSRLRAKWIAQGIQTGGSPDHLHVEKLKANAICPLPDDFLTYFAEVNGMKPGEMDDHNIHFCSIDEILSESPRLNSDFYLPDETNIEFADFLIQSFLYVLTYDSELSRWQVCAQDGGTKRVICATFVGFLELYLEDPESLCRVF